MSLPLFGFLFIEIFSSFLVLFKKKKDFTEEESKEARFEFYLT